MVSAAIVAEHTAHIGSKGRPYAWQARKTWCPKHMASHISRADLTFPDNCMMQMMGGNVTKVPYRIDFSMASACLESDALGQ